ncbi:MAG: pseudouridine synthase, partial [Oscillospiraceae bacterium]|nr:pseudouridine synthase [Oscillospiraceae bacterium]
MALIRIQKILADSGYCSRRKAEALIQAGRVQRNGRPVKLGDKASPKDLISVDGQKIVVPRKKNLRYLMLNKPRGYVTTVSDELDRRCVMDLLEDVEERVYPIGRLDRNSEGLLLLTNDGRFANDIMHPSKHVSKTYRVTVRPSITEEQLARMATGIILDGKKTLPANIGVVTNEPGRVG